MSPRFRRVAPRDADAVVSFLCAHAWPFHGQRHLSPDEAATIPIFDADGESHWVLDGDVTVGLIRLFDLDDLGEGSPLFDLRIGTEHRRRGLGTAAVNWLSTHLFSEHPNLHRLEATTRSDNLAMRTVLDHCGFRCEGVLREAWKNHDGSRNDCCIYGLLRREWAALGRVS